MSLININMEVKPKENATCNKSNNSLTKVTNTESDTESLYEEINLDSSTNPPKPKSDTDYQYEEIILNPSKPSNHHDNAHVGFRNSITTNTLTDPSTQPAHPWWRKRISKHILVAVAVVCVCLVVCIAAVIAMTRNHTSEKGINRKNYNNSQTTPISQDGSNHAKDDNSQISLVSQTERNQIQARPGFTAWAQNLIDFEKGNTIKFTGVKLNEGGLYSNITGRFSCDVGGVYYVAVTLKRTADDNDNLEMRVYKGGDQILTVRDEGVSNPGVSTTNSRLVVCKAGNYLVMRGWEPGTVYGEHTVPYSTFTAFLMQKTDTRGFVGFTATTASFQMYRNGETLRFPRELYNEGGHFNPATNRFVCPVSGVYYVSVAIKTFQHPLHVCVSKSNRPYLHANSDNNNSLTITNTALVRCRRNEAIDVKGTGKGKLLNMIRKEVYTTFTGMLLLANVGHGKNSFIGLSVYKKTTQRYTISQTISFDGELMNKDHYFHVGLNRFVCPVNAVYYISLNAKKDESSPLVIDVKVHTDTVFRVQSAESKSLVFVMSNSAFVKCFSGQVMHVEGAGTGSVYGHHSEKHTTFTVFMVHQY